MDLLKKGFYFLLAATVLVACSDDDDAVVPGGGGGEIPGGGGSDHPLAGTSWSLNPAEAALVVGPNATDVWWASSADDVTTRACLFDDTYVFNADGTFSQSMQDATWLESWQAGEPAEGCGAPIAPHNGSNAATWTADSSTITIVGDGAFLGLAKVHNTAEDGDPADDTIVYNYVLDGNTLTVSISGFQSGGTETWTYVFSKN
jgi:hypothetical protein